MKKSEDSTKTVYTKSLLATQLIQMLEKQTFKKITVNALCQRACISRSTFYLYFQDKYDLLRYCLDSELQQWESRTHSSDLKTFLLFTLDSFWEKRRIFYNIFVNDADWELNNIFHLLFTRFFTKRIEAWQAEGHTLPGPIPVVSAFYTGGLIAANIQWMQNNFDISKEEMAECQQRLLTGLFD